MRKKPTEETELSRFQKLARALFGVDKRDVPKHEPKKREKRDVPKHEAKKRSPAATSK